MFWATDIGVTVAEPPFALITPVKVSAPLTIAGLARMAFPVAMAPAVQGPAGALKPEQASAPR